MVDLLDRLQHPDATVPNEDIITTHAFTGAITLVTLGKITKAQVVAKWNITGDALTQLDAIAAVLKLELKEKQ